MGIPLQPSATKPPPVPLRTKIAFGIGSAAENLALYSVSTFAMLFYNQVLGLPAHFAGLMLSVSLIVDGIADPIIGSWSDRTRSRLGRRHPFMFLAPLPVAAAFFAIFNPPDGLGEASLIAWFGCSVIALRLAMALYHVPHMALGGELSPRYLERTSIMSYAAFFNWAGSSFAWWSAYAIFFPTTPEYETGLLNPAPWPLFAGVVAALALVILFACAWFTRDRIPYLPAAKADTPPFAARALLRDIASALSNKNFAALLVGWLLYFVMNGVRDGLWLYTANFYWRLSSEELSWWVVGSFAGWLFGFLLARRFHGWFDKRRTLVLAMAAFALGPALPYLLAFAGVIGPDTPHLNAILIALALLEHAPQALVTISVWSTLADIADENELRFGIRQEGMLFAARLLVMKIGLGVGSALAGLAITLVALPTAARPGQISPTVLFHLNLAYTSAALLGFLAAAAFLGYRITNATYAATRAALAARNDSPAEPTGPHDAAPVSSRS